MLFEGVDWVSFLVFWVFTQVKRQSSNFGSSINLFDLIGAISLYTLPKGEQRYFFSYLKRDQFSRILLGLTLFSWSNLSFGLMS